jgi:hypothetical protein
VEQKQDFGDDPLYNVGKHPLWLSDYFHLNGIKLLITVIRHPFNGKSETVSGAHCAAPLLFYGFTTVNECCKTSSKAVFLLTVGDAGAL